MVDFESPRQSRTRRSRVTGGTRGVRRCWALGALAMLRRGPPWSSVLPRVINARRVPGRLVAPRGHRYSSLRLRGPANEARQPLPDTVEVTPRPEGLPAARAPTKSVCAEKPLSSSPTACSGRSTMSWRSRRTTGSLGRTITTGDRPLGPRVAPWPSWSGSATGSPSHPQHERHPGRRRIF